MRRKTTMCLCVANISCIHETHRMEIDFNASNRSYVDLTYSGHRYSLTKRKDTLLFCLCLGRKIAIMLQICLRSSC